MPGTFLTVTSATASIVLALVLTSVLSFSAGHNAGLAEARSSVLCQQQCPACYCPATWLLWACLIFSFTAATFSAMPVLPKPQQKDAADVKTE